MWCEKGKKEIPPESGICTIHEWEKGKERASLFLFLSRQEDRGERGAIIVYRE